MGFNGYSMRAFPWEPTNLGILAQICHGTELLCHNRAPKQQKTMISPRENDDLHRLIVDV